jgi:hypothetical protein
MDAVSRWASSTRLVCHVKRRVSGKVLPPNLAILRGKDKCRRKSNTAFGNQFVERGISAGTDGKIGPMYVPHSSGTIRPPHSKPPCSSNRSGRALFGDTSAPEALGRRGMVWRFVPGVSFIRCSKRSGGGTTLTGRDIALLSTLPQMSYNCMVGEKLYAFFDLSLLCDFLLSHSS